MPKKTRNLHMYVEYVCTHSKHKNVRCTNPTDLKSHRFAKTCKIPPKNIFIKGPPRADKTGFWGFPANPTDLETLQRIYV